MIFNNPYCTFASMCRSVQRSSILEVPEDEEKDEPIEEPIEEPIGEPIDEVANDIEKEEETDGFMFYTALQPIQQLWYYLVPSS